MFKPLKAPTGAFFMQQKRSLAGLFQSHTWLGQIKQALTIYKEDIRNRLEEYNPEK